MGVVHAPCINNSDYPNVIYGKDIHLGLGYIKELETNVVQRILKNRQFFGSFKSFNDFIDRVDISIEQLSILQKIPIPFTWGFYGPSLCPEIYLNHFKTGRKSLCPFKVICTGLGQIVIYFHSILFCPEPLQPIFLGILLIIDEF